jgi:hypothetical protein
MTKPACTISVDVIGPEVRLTISGQGQTIVSGWSPRQARELAEMLQRGAVVAEVCGQPHGHA